MPVKNIKELNTAIRSLKTRSATYRADVQTALISCAFHSAKDGQITPFNDLLEAVGNGVRKAGIVMWAETFGFVQFSAKDGNFINNKASRKDLAVANEDDFAPYLKSIDASPSWCDMVKPEPIKSMFDEDAYIAKVLEKLTKEGSDIASFLEVALISYKADKAVKELKLLAEKRDADAKLLDDQVTQGSVEQAILEQVS